MATIRVEHAGDDAFDIRIRDHVVRVDQKAADGGADTGPTPTELFVASLASCIAFYARRYLARHDLSSDGLVVVARSTGTTKPARVARVEVEITLPEGFPADRVDALVAVSSHCTVHSSLQHPPEVVIGVTRPAVAPV